MSAPVHSGTALTDRNVPAPAIHEVLTNDTSLPGVFLMTDSFDTGGSERQFAALAKSLDPYSFRIHLGCIQKRGAFLDGLSDVGEFPLGGSLYRLGSLRARWKLSRYMRRNAIDIAHAFDFYTNLTLIPAARFARIPVVIGSQRQLGDLLSPAQFRAQLAMLRWCDAVVCNSSAAADRLIQHGLQKEKIVVIGNGLPDSCFLETAPALPRHPGLFRIGMIARMNALSKNHSLFLRAAARLVSKFRDLEFVLIGDGPLRAELESESRNLGIYDQTRFLGNRRDIPAVLASLDLTVLPSASESLSNAIIESFAAGVPVIASRVGGNPELVNESSGILVAPDDEVELANAVEHLLKDNALRLAMGRNANEFAKARFTVDNMRRQHEALYAELLEKKRWKPRARSSQGFLEPQVSTQTRIAIVAASLRYVGGQSVQADLLLRNWKQDSEIAAELIPIDPLFPHGLKWIERIPLLRTIVREPLYILELWRGLKHTDIVHIFSASYWSFLVAPFPAWLVAGARRKKTLIHYHSGEARDHLRRFRTARPLLARADMLVVPSRYLVDVFREFNLQAKVVPNVVDLTQFSFRLRNPLRPHLVCTRGFHAYYSVDVVVRAFAEVLKSFPDARLDLVGGGQQEADIKNLVRRLKLPNVNFCGVAAHKEIGRFYNQADIFINASCLDNMPVSVIEAFASGTPVVSTAPESMPYLVEHERTGLLSPVGDERALAANVVRLLREPELARQLAANAYEESQHYAWPEVRAQWIDVYRSLSR